MKLFEMEGFLRGKCLPGDMKVNETNAEYLVRKFTELEQKLAESQREFRAADATIENLQMQVEKLATENAVLKSGFKYFSYSEMAGFEEHGTAELAMKSADADLAGERDEASSEGWSEETDTICWGVIVQKAVENKFEKASEENGWIGWSDYSLLPSIETPETDAFLAEVRAQAWIEGNVPAEFGRYWVRYETDVGPQYCSAKWMEHNFCAGSDTNIHKIWLADHSRSINSLKGVTHYTMLPESIEGGAK
ncbi:hypothetical protein ACVGWG_23025 [Enterobacter asburiae]|uniref:hypothetical protein n=1 Tax=Enterobacter asburiae TaxID=61645 RepID=UPI001CC2F856|nr:hypothetical protein [Enterobacter asburiae]